ncbi:MAG TPA: magnesium-translocating P-type ATPase [Steroidobacteraceae bacterium]|nr:magnesium-translocating P-type ATPase [Steroidobacteraceae bacterium]
MAGPFAGCEYANGVPDPPSSWGPMSGTIPFWNRPLIELLQELDARTQGLSTAQARQRLEESGPNQLQEHDAPSLLVGFLSRFKSPLVLLLLGASIVMALTGDRTGCLIISAIVLLSVSLDFFQEYQAGKVVDALRKSIAIHTCVIRDGNPADIAVDALVPGDLIHLSAGDLIPADGRVIEAKDFFVNQAALTGEPYPVEKHAGDLAAAAKDLNEANNAVFAGGSAISGMARVLVCHTGGGTEFSQIASGLAERRPPTAFELGIRHFGVLIMRLTALLVLSVLLINWFLHRPILESVLFSIALAVGLTPELLPMIITVTLSRGAVRMARKQVIVKQLEAIHNLGCMDVLCTDKTGTLTEATIQLAKHIDGRGTDSARVLQLAYLNSHFETGLKSPLDDAILAQPGVQVDAYRKIDEVPFDFERRRVSVLVADGAAKTLVVKGAPEDVLQVCAQWAADEDAKAEPLDDAARATVQQTHDALAEQGFRLLGVAYRQVPATQEHACLDDESRLIFAGFAAFLDPPKADAGRAVQALTESGIRVKIVTGDNELVTRHVCGSVGLPIQGVLSGREVAELDDLALGARAEAVNVFCRVTPQQKNRIIRALKLRGHTVGYLGDGINDAPSLHSADIGISVDGAVDVAKGAAQLVLLKHDLEVLHDGVIEGRRTFGNVMKYILMATSSNFGNMFSMAGAVLFLPFLPMLPMQILLNNLLYDLSELALPFDTVDEEDLRRPRRWDMKIIRRFMWVIGPVSSIFDFLTFYLMMVPFRATEAAFHTGWFVESIATQVLVVFIIRTRGNPFKSRCSPWLAASSLAVVLLAAALPLTPFAGMLGFVPLPSVFLGALACIVAAYLALVWIAKRILDRRTVADT